MKKILLTITLLSLQACASIIDGHTQAIAVNTNPPKADCVLNRQNAPIGEIQSTPGSLVIEKTRDDINIACNKNGYQQSTTMEKSGVDGWVFGNIALGGLIGLAVDAGTGAINKYDTPVNITLVPEEEHISHHKKNNDDE